MTLPAASGHLLSLLTTVRANADAARPRRWTRCHLLVTRHSDSHVSYLNLLWVGETEIGDQWFDDDAAMSIPESLLSWTDELAAAGEPVWHVLVLGMTRAPADYRVRLLYPGDPEDTGWEVDPRNTQPTVDNILAAVGLPDPAGPVDAAGQGTQPVRGPWWRRIVGDRTGPGAS